MSECNIKCPFVSNDNKYDVLIIQLKREIAQIKETTNVKNLLYENKLNELCLHIKNNLSNEIRLLFDSMNVSGELENIITSILLSDIKQVTYKTDGFISVKQFGAMGNGLCDDTEALQNAIDNLKENETLIINDGVFLCRSLKIEKNNVKIIMNGTIKQLPNVSDNLLIIKGKNIQLVNVSLERECSMLGSSIEDMRNIGLRIEECKNVIVDNASIKNFNVGINIHSDIAGCAYIEIKNPYIVAHECINTSGSSWTNEVHIFGGRLSIHETYSVYDGSAYANLNGDCFRFNSVCMEGTKVERKIKGNFSNSSFIGCRFEGTNKSGTDIEIKGDWNLFLHNRDMGLNISDEGIANNIFDFSTFRFNSAIATKIKHFKSTVENNKLNLSWQAPLLLVDASLKSATISTPNVNSVYEKGVEMTVKKIDDSENTVYVYFRSGEADGVSDTVLRKKNEAITFISDGEKWYIKNWYKPQ